MRELAYIQTIKSLSPIPNADAIEKAEVLGWELVVKKGEFKVGDRCVYVEIDSILPPLPPFEFLRPKNFRIKTVKLRSQISQGIAFPISVLKEVDPSFDISNLKIGQDVSEALKITKYDPEAELDVEVEQEKKFWLSNKLSYLKWKLFGQKPIKRGQFPIDVPKTEEVRVQKMGRALAEHTDEPAYITEKLEGTSSTFVYRTGGNWLAKLFKQDGSFQVCSRNLIVFNSQNNKKRPHHLIDIADKYKIYKSMRQLNRNLAVQGEVIGPKIQGNIYKLNSLEFRVFSIFDIDAQKYVDYNELCSLCSQLNLTMVPIVGLQKIVNNISHYVELSKDKSQINKDILREGIVVRTLDGSLSFKSINPEYLLKQN